MRLSGRIDLPPGTPAVLDPSTTGVQLRLDDVGLGGAAVLDLTAATTPVAGGVGCDPRDGWRGTTYRNRSGALPPACAPGSAQGLSRLKLRDRRARARGIAVSLKVQHGTLGPLAGPLDATIVLDAARGPCGVQRFASCRVRSAGSGLDCR